MKVSPCKSEIFVEVSSDDVGDAQDILNEDDSSSSEEEAKQETPGQKELQAKFEGDAGSELLSEMEKMKNIKRLSDDHANSSCQDQPDATALSNLSIND